MSFDPTYPHLLDPLPPTIAIPDAAFGNLLLKARVELAELKGACGQIPNPLLLTAPTVMRESVASSNIENINTTLAEVLQWQLFPEAKQRQPDKEVLRYRDAILWGYEQLNRIPISTRMITGIQARLLPDGNGAFRREQNRIINMATREDLYTPPPAQNVNALISNWENYVNSNSEDIDPLIRTIIAHYQFEAIHPFRDGNGRTGRILMILQLVQENLLSMPVLYISGYINQNRSEYYRRLLAVTTNNEWVPYIHFMLNGFYLQARETRNTLSQTTSLFREIKEQIKTEAGKIYSAELVDALFTYPILTPTRLATELNMHYTTTSKYLIQLSGMGILKEAIVGKYHLYANHQLMDILRKE
jgi:Fic family protein